MRSLEEIIADESEYVLSTVDNPYNPFTHWDEWFAFDLEKGYSTCGLLDRLTHDVIDNNKPDEWNDIRVKEAIEHWIEIDPLHLYCKVFKDGHKEPGDTEPISE